jgi:cephalosporin hydroxylase
MKAEIISKDKERQKSHASYCSGKSFGNAACSATVVDGRQQKSFGQLSQIFEKHSNGLGVWKWVHYLDIYDKHLKAYQGKETTIVEIGVFSGGSLQMWREYFGKHARVIGVDIEPKCKEFESYGFEIFTGDQGSRLFWQDSIPRIGAPDVVIDDGGHHPDQQRTSLEELLPVMAPGGVYIVEDVFGINNEFSSWLHGLAASINDNTGRVIDRESAEKRALSPCHGIMKFVESISFYPYLVVIQLLRACRHELLSQKKGSEWLGHLQ